MPQLALGLLRLEEGRADEAWPAFERAVAAAPDDFFAQYAYGVSRLRHQAAAADQSGRTAAIDRARAALGKAAAINPSSSEAFAWLAYAEMLSDNRLGEARAAIARAIDDLSRQYLQCKRTGFLHPPVAEYLTLLFHKSSRRDDLF